MPLDTSGESGQIDPHLITNAVLDSKDVDGLSVVNQVLFQVWLLTQFYSVDFSQARIVVKNVNFQQTHNQGLRQ